MSDDTATDTAEEATDEVADQDAAPPEPETPPGVPVTINGTVIQAEPGELLIDAAERNGTYIPRFCYHPRMKPVGMCRMCLVEVDTGRGMSLQPSCMLPVSENMVVETESEASKAAQDGVLEFLLINHPLDCPVCDKGGECPLQDQTMAFGPGESRFVEEKRHFEKPIAISETVYLDRERCILCDRCTRFAADVAGDALIHFQGRGNHTEVNTFPDHPFASYFSGNTVQICPVGALTAKPYRFKARPWDLEETSSTCDKCSVGCQVTVQSSRDKVVRYLGVDSDPVNWGWLCDKGRFGFEAVNHDDRLSDAMVDGASVGWSTALRAATAALRTARDTGGADRIGVIGGARLTNEDAFAWAKLAKGVLGTDNVDAQLGDGLDGKLVQSLPRATIDEVCAPGGTVIWLAPDPREELPVLFLRMRHAVEEDNVTLIELSSAPTSLSPLASASLSYRPGDAAAVAQALISGEPGTVIDPAALELVRNMMGENPPTVVVGRPDLGESAASIGCAIEVLSTIDGVRFLPALRRGNVFGALDMGLSPGLLPGRRTLDAGAPDDGWSAAPSTDGMHTAEMLAAGARGELDVLVLLGADPLTDFADRALAAAALEKVPTVIALDRFPTASVRAANIVFPVAGAAECSGTMTNLEGRVTRLNQKVTPPRTARSDWMVAAEIALALGSDLGVGSVDDITGQIAASSPAYAPVTAAAVDAGVEGVLVTDTAVGTPASVSVASTNGPADGLRLLARRRLYDLGTDLGHCESSTALVTVGRFRLHPDDAAAAGVGHGEEVAVSSARGELTGQVLVDASITPGTISSYVNVVGVDGVDLIDTNADYTTVTVRGAAS